MKHILKVNDEPRALTDYKLSNANAPERLTWEEFSGDTRAKKEVKHQLREDQRALCAYCEISLRPDDETVEHFIPCSADRNKELDWQNLLLCCAGGEQELAEDKNDRYSSARYDRRRRKGRHRLTCGAAKQDRRNEILNPLKMPYSPSLFQIKAETGEIMANEEACREKGIPQDIVEDTISLLRLNMLRLSEVRLDTVNYYMDLLVEDNTDVSHEEKERALAERDIPRQGPLPAFFTTIRWALGDGAEQYLREIGFEG